MFAEDSLDVLQEVSNKLTELWVDVHFKLGQKRKHQEVVSDLPLQNHAFLDGPLDERGNKVLSLGSDILVIFQLLSFHEEDDVLDRLCC